VGKPYAPAHSSRPLILYAYAESETARSNIKFFLKLGLHSAADFIFILNGPTNISTIIPREFNIQVVVRENKCFDLGAYNEVLRQDDLWKKYTRFITMNASIRGPFVPYWSRSCWSDVYLDRLSDSVKLVGMTANCVPRMHIQSMIWATDSVGMGLLLHPPENYTSAPDFYGEATDPVGLSTCFTTLKKAVHAEIGSTALITDSGYEVEALLAAWHMSGETFEDWCKREPVDDFLWHGHYFGGNVHAYETLFMKANRDMDPDLLAKLTEWHSNNGVSSRDVCR
jgi:hypothetical protein